MPLRVKTASGEEVVPLATLKAAFIEHPPDVVVAMIDHAQSVDVAVPIASMTKYLSTTLDTVCATVWAQQLGAIAPGGPDLHFVKPPSAAVTQRPRRIGATPLVMAYSSYLATEQLDIVIALGTKALARLAQVDFMMKIPDASAPERLEILRSHARELGAILRAARCALLVRGGQDPMALELAPGRVLPEVERCVLAVAGSLRRLDTIDPIVWKSWTAALGFEPPPPPDDTLDKLGPIYGGIDDLLRGAGTTVTRLGDDLINGTGTDWTLEGTRVRTHQPIVPLWDGANVREHAVVPGLRPPPPTIYGEELESASMPLVFVLSDLHLGQGASDGAEEIDVALDAAFVQTIDAWDARVTGYRGNHPSSPAYLVLNGDILDFWSADVIPGPSPVSDMVARTVGGQVRAYLPRDAASARMDRILAAHSVFFDRIRSWVTANSLNFLVYICGNHDDHLVRYQLGGALAQRLGGPRGVFAAKSAYFPQLNLLIEHGHRSDDHNRTDPAFDHGIGCLGELIVAMLINPIERGGFAALLSLRDVNGATIDVAAAHGLQDTVGALRTEYDKIHAGRAAAPHLYDRVLREIDNLENSGAEDILIDYVRRQNAGAADAMEGVGEAIEEVQRIWTSDEFQSLAVHIGGRIGPLFPPYARAAVVDETFAADHPGDLGFDPASGLNGHRSMKVHVVGHTHRPRLTTPRLAGNEVPAQHVNTGTGQNMWVLEDRCFGIDLLNKAGITQPADHIRPVNADQYCMIYLAVAGNDPNRRLKIHVEGGSYRMTQSYSPLNPGAIQGGLTPQGTNTLEL